MQRHAHVWEPLALNTCSKQGILKSEGEVFGDLLQKITRREPSKSVSSDLVPLLQICDILDARS